MKYWWLEKYHNFKIIQMKELLEDINYFLIMPKNYQKQYLILKDKRLDSLVEEELLILLYKIVSTKNMKDNTLNLIINKLLMIPDNSFPTSDYKLQEMLDEIKNLKNNPPFKNKIETNNIAICYHCLNVFYVDKIKNINKNNLCLCPYCLSTKLYFDNDYIPMNYTFIKLANIYYETSDLGCTFKEIQKIMKKNIRIEIETTNENNINLTEFFSNKLNPIDEKIISKEIHDLLMKKEYNFEYEANIYIENIERDVVSKLLLLLVSIMDVLSNSIYLKQIKIITNKKISINIKELLKVLEYC